jgi:hypothetical protein
VVVLKKPVKKIIRLLAGSSPTSRLHRLARLHGKDLELRQNHLAAIKKNDVLLFAVMKNEAHRLRFFIDYYRKLGVSHFILVDNGSADHFNEVVAGQGDITTYYTAASYKASNYGMHWCNDLLRRHGCGHWCMTCDPDEFLVYPYMETRDLLDLTAYLDSLRESSFFTTMIDMYGDRAVEESFYREGEDPLSVCAYFDGTGYSKTWYSRYENTFIQGGVRRRMFYADNPGKAPALNKVPLIKWQKHYAYVESMHMALPRRLNHVFACSKTSGALLHFKFISQLVDKVKDEELAQQHWDNSSEYKKYGEAIKTRTLLHEPSVSVRYENWRTLARFGLVNLGEW